MFSPLIITQVRQQAADTFFARFLSMQAAAYAVLSDDSGQGLVEYALIIGLVAIAAVAGLTIFGKKLNNNIGNSSQVINSLS
jgi:pilus assembly protein Flp/PilA